MISRIWASSISISRGSATEISLCFRLTELGSTVILKPSWEQSPRPYPVIDLIEEEYGRNRTFRRINFRSAAAVLHIRAPHPAEARLWHQRRSSCSQINQSQTSLE